MNATGDNPAQSMAEDAGDAQGEIERLKQKLGAQGNEIGQLRNALEAKIDERDAELIGESFDSDQVAAMERLMEKKLAPVAAAVNQTSSTAAEQKLVSKHPDYQDVITDERFQAWVSESRVNAAAYEAAIAGDIDTGIALLDSYKGANPATPPRDVVATALSSSRGSSGDSGIREGGTFSREEIRHLKMHDKPKYRAMLPEIMKAYQEGRVR
ncbi:MAG: hypothetical protein HKN13_09525 [Rhodothermales bacterium]|nr:hypothetical protein [Rhodothermales bacterium]